MPESTDQRALHFRQKYIDEQLLIVTTNEFYLQGTLVSFDYDRSIMLRDATEYVKIEKNAVFDMGDNTHLGFEVVSRRDILIPGVLVKKIYKAKE